MSHLTADIICRTVFSTSLEHEATRSSSMPSRFRTLRRAGGDPPPDPGPRLDAHSAEAACAGCLHADPRASGCVAGHAPRPRGAPSTTSAPVIVARDRRPGLHARGTDRPARRAVPRRPRDQRQRVDLGVLHPGHAARRGGAPARGSGPSAATAPSPSSTPRLPFIRNIFRETLRLYPPITFLPRVAIETSMMDTAISAARW